MSKQYLIATIFLAGFLTTAMPPLWAASPAEEAIDKREDLMKDMGGHMKAIKKILGGATDIGTIVEHANGMATLTNTLATDLKVLFPVGSNQGDSEAKSTIWQNWAEFEKIAQSAASKGAALKADSSSDASSAYKAMGEVCKSCHKDYRAEK